MNSVQVVGLTGDVVTIDAGTVEALRSSLRGALLVEGEPIPMKQRIAAQSTRLGGLIVAIEGPSGEPERTICDFSSGC